MELKNCKTLDFEILKKNHDAKEGVFSGYLSVFGNVDAGRDIVHKGAFKNSLSKNEKKGRKIPILWQHDPSKPVGIYTKLIEDDNGLFVEGHLAMGTQQGKEANSLMEIGALTGMSIGYRAIKKTWDSDRKVRNLLELDLMEGSLVTFPMNDESRIQMNGFKSIRDFETSLRDAGYSRSQAKGIAAHGYSGLEQRDAGTEAISQGIESLLEVFNN